MKDKVSSSHIGALAAQLDRQVARGFARDRMKTVRGDLLKLGLDGRFDVIVHGCNCQCVMRAGIALAIRNTFPEAFAADCATTKSDRKKLGTISVAPIERNGRSLVIVNAYTQYHWRGRGPCSV